MKTFKTVLALLICLCSVNMRSAETLDVLLASRKSILSDHVSGGGERLANMTWIDMIVRGGDVDVGDVAFKLTATPGIDTHLAHMYLAKKDGSIMAATSVIVRQEKLIESHDDEYIVSFSRLQQTVKEGTNTWIIKGVFTNLPSYQVEFGFGISSVKNVSGVISGKEIVPQVDPSTFLMFVHNKVEYTGKLERNLTVGSVGEDVKFLQSILNTDLETRIVSEGAGSPGKETLEFDANMKASVMKFQAKHGLPMTGFVGPLTRGYINTHDELMPQVRIKSVIYESQFGLNFIVRLQATVVPFKKYLLQVTTDFVKWEDIEFGLWIKSETAMINAQVGLISLIQYGEKAFFRLVEKP